MEKGELFLRLCRRFVRRKIHRQLPGLLGFLGFQGILRFLGFLGVSGRLLENLRVGFKEGLGKSRIRLHMQMGDVFGSRLVPRGRCVGTRLSLSFGRAGGGAFRHFVSEFFLLIVLCQKSIWNKTCASCVLRTVPKEPVASWFYTGC